jgi:hypothetical protein
MVRFYLQKLVRDKVVPNCLDDPEVVHTEYRELDSQEFRRELVCKVHEEADEIPLGDKQRDEALKELADLQEVVDALRQAFGFSDEQVKEEMARKKQKKGGFDNRHYIEYNDLVDDSKWVEIFRAQPEKYREETVDSEEQSHRTRISKGIYRHSKSGKLYEVIGLALETEVEELLVIYRPLYENEYELFARPASMFTETIVLDGKSVPRFQKITPKTRV